MKRKLIFALLLCLLLPVAAFSQSEDIFSSEALPSDSALYSFEEDIRYAEADTILRVALVLSDIYGKKDMEFTRGMLLGIQNASLPPNSLSLKIVNGEIPEDSLSYELELFEPHVIVSTMEKDALRPLNDYLSGHEAKVLNVFDTKSDDNYLNRTVYQLLAPSQTFNSLAAAYFVETFPGNILLIVGEQDPSDQILQDMLSSWAPEDVVVIPMEALEELTLDEKNNYLIYPASSSGNDVKEVLRHTLRLMADYPEAGIRIAGRPNWIAFNDLNTMITNMEVFIPARCYFDASSAKGKRFIGDYHGLFGHAPIRSYPVYAVMGYDTASYFLPGLVDEIKGMEPSWDRQNMVQSYFNLERSSPFNTFYNNGVFMIHCEPWGTMEKIILEQ